MYWEKRPFSSILKAMTQELDGDSTGHDIHHLKRVCRLGVKLAEEEDADKDVVAAAALTHDLHRVTGEGFTDPRETLPRIEEMLRNAGFPEDKIDGVLHCVDVHEGYSFEKDQREPETLEAEILRDADNLDAIGAVGIGRTFMFSGAHGNPMWRPEEKQSGSYDKTDLDNSTIYHCHDKLLRLRDEMNTNTALEIAEERHEYMAKFVERFKDEWKGDL